MGKFEVGLLILLLLAGMTLGAVGMQMARVDILQAQYDDLFVWFQQWEHEKVLLQERNQRLVLENMQLQQKFHAYNLLETRDFNSMAELLYFIADDDTDTMLYIPEEWVCSHYTFKLMERAAEKGLRMYPVIIYGYDYAHMLCFAVVDKYLPMSPDPYKVVVAVEPQTDEVIILGLLYDIGNWESIESIIARHER